MRPSATILHFDVTVTPIEADTLLNGSLPVTIRVISSDSFNLIIFIHPKLTANAKLTAKTSVTILQPSLLITRLAVITFQADDSGFCGSPHPLTFRGFSLNELTDNDQLSISIDFEPFHSPQSSITWNPNPRDSTLINRRLFNIVGFLTSGSTGHLHSVLQIFFHCVPFRQLILSSENSTPFVDILKALFLELETSLTDCASDALLNAFGWAHENPRDAAESWTAIITALRSEGLEEQLRQLFVLKGRFAKRTDDETFLELAPEESWLLPLAIAGCDTVQGAFGAYLKEKSVNNGEFCIRAEIVEAPEVLALQIARVDFDFQKFQEVKRVEIVEVGEDLEVSVGESVFHYTLRGVIAHEGGITDGRYSALVKVGEDWFDIRNAAIGRLKFSEVLTKAGRTGYIVLYGKNVQ
jgi:hypothetical protein